MFKLKQADVGRWPEYIKHYVNEVFRIIVGWLKGGKTRNVDMTGEAGWFQAELVAAGERTPIASYAAGTPHEAALQTLKNGVEEQIARLLAHPELRCSRESTEPFARPHGAAVGFELTDGRIVVFAFANNRQRADADETIALSIAGKAGYISGGGISDYSRTRKNGFLASLVETMHRIDRENFTGF